LIIVLGQKKPKQWRQKKKDGDKIVCGSGVQDRMTVSLSYLVMTDKAL